MQIPPTREDRATSMRAWLERKTQGMLQTSMVAGFLGCPWCQGELDKRVKMLPSVTPVAKTIPCLPVTV